MLNFIEIYSDYRISPINVGQTHTFHDENFLIFSPMIYDSIQHHRTRQSFFERESECSTMIRTEQILRRSTENWANLLHLRGNCGIFFLLETENILNTHRVCELLTDFTWTVDMLDDNKVRTRQTNLRPTLFHTQSALKLPFTAERS